MSPKIKHKSQWMTTASMFNLKYKRSESQATLVIRIHNWSKLARWWPRTTSRVPQMASWVWEVQKRTICFSRSKSKHIKRINRTRFVSQTVLLKVWEFKLLNSMRNQEETDHSKEKQSINIALVWVKTAYSTASLKNKTFMIVTNSSRLRSSISLTRPQRNQVVRKKTSSLIA